MSVLVGGNRPVTRFYNFDILQFLEGTVTVANATTYRITDATGYHQFTGNFTYDPDGTLSGGTITGWTRITNGGTEFTLSGLNYPVALFLADLATGDDAGLLNSVLGNNDKITGSTAGDVLSGYDGKDTMDGAGGNDVLFGLQGDDSLVGGIGNDILQGGDGNDTLAGGIGDDRYFDVDLSDTVSEKAGQGIDEVRTKINGHVLENNVENLVLDGTGDISGKGNTLANVITGNSGKNQLQGMEGNDTLDGGAGIDSATGGTGDDLYVVDETTDQVNELLNQGTDTVRSHATTYTLSDNVENLELWSGGFTGIGNALANKILGPNSDNFINGLAGNDTIESGGGQDSLLGGADNDLLSGGQGLDLLLGEEGADTLSGDSDDDTLDGGSEIDLMVGGAGDDTYFVRESSDKIVEAAGPGGGIDTVQTFADYTMAANVESLQLNSSGTAAIGNALDNIMSIVASSAKLSGLGGIDSLSGGGGNDTLDGGVGDDGLSGGGGGDSLIGGAGMDQLDGEAGNDTMAGGAGDDLFFVDSTGDVVQEAAGQGFDMIISEADYALTDEIQVERLFFSDTGTGKSGQGNKFANYILGNSLDNTLQGGEGNDTLQGAVGADSLLGGKGDDIYFVTDANDKIVENSNEGLDQVTSTIDFSLLALGTSVENLGLSESGGAITGIGSSGANAIIGNSKNNLLDGLNDNDSIAGLGGNDSIDGGAGNDSLLGGDGADSLEGGIGDDTMLGGKGSDFYHVDSAKDLVVEAAEPFSVDRLFTTVDNTTLVANVEYLILEGTAVTGYGNALDNLVNGNANNNKLYGLAGNDSVYGGLGNDLLDGGAGNDALQAAGGADTMIGGAGNDQYLIDNNLGQIIEAAGGGIDTVESDVTTADLGDYKNVENLRFSTTASSVGTGNAFNNLIEGNNGDDKLTGNAGNDTLSGGAGKDTMDGGDGDDTYVVDNADDVIVEGVGPGKDTIIGRTSVINLGLDAFNVENVLLETGGLTVFGNALANRITGNIGDNLLTGAGGNDTLSGDSAGSLVASNDTMDGSIGDDLMLGGFGDDTYWVSEKGDKVVELANQGSDTVRALIDYTMAVNVENLILESTATKGTGNASDNKIDGNVFNNTILGLGGNDSLTGLTGNDTLDGGDGNDTLSGGGGNDKLVGGAGFNRLQGDDDSDTLIGGVNSDTLDGGVGVDSMAGGGGSDNYFVDNKNDSILEGAGQGADSVFATVDYTLPANVETLYVTGPAKNGTGNAGANSILGNGESNMLIGLAGNDTFFGGIGGEADTMVGGAGNDLYSVDTTADVVDEDPLSGGSGIDLVVTSVSINLASMSAFVENVRLSGSAKDAAGNALANVIEGTAGNNSLFGAAGADTLIGGDGLDSLGGGAGLDVMVGGNGNDYYAVDAAADKVIEGKGGGIDTVEAFVDYTLAAEVEILNLTVGTNGTGNALGNVIDGNPFANKLSGLGGGDALTGEGGSDTLLGGDGNDLLVGGADNDSMVGGTGDDIYLVEQSGDIVFESAGQGHDQVNSMLSVYTLAANVENLSLVGASAVTGIGNGLDNLIRGNFGLSVGNVLQGAAGNDTLDGTGGADTLTGGTGRDHFLITATDAVDHITDFDAGALGDTVDLSDLLTGYIPGTSNPNLFVQFVVVGGDTTVQVDADGAGGGSTFQDVVVLEGVTFSSVNQAVLEGNLQLA